MPEPAVIVFERRPRWAPELQRQFVGQEVRVRACRMTADILPMASADGIAVIVIDFEAAAGECLQFLGRLAGRTLWRPVIVIGSQRTADLEWPVREMGALAFLSGPVSGDNLARLCRRQWDWQSAFSDQLSAGRGSLRTS